MGKTDIDLVLVDGTIICSYVGGYQSVLAKIFSIESRESKREKLQIELISLLPCQPPTSSINNLVLLLNSSLSKEFRFSFACSVDSISILFGMLYSSQLIKNELIVGYFNRQALRSPLQIEWPKNTHTHTHSEQFLLLLINITQM